MHRTNQRDLLIDNVQIRKGLSHHRAKTAGRDYDVWLESGD